MPGPVGGLRKHPHGRVDQLEDRYLGMVEAPSSNLGTSTSILPIEVSEVDCAAKTDSFLIASVFGSVRPPEIIRLIHSSSPCEPRQKGTKLPPFVYDESAMPIISRGGPSWTFFNSAMTWSMIMVLSSPASITLQTPEFKNGLSLIHI